MVAEAMSSVAMGVSQISEPEQVPDATIVMPDIQSIEQPEDTQLRGEDKEESSENREEQEVSVTPEEEFAESDEQEPEVSESPDETVIIPEIEEEEEMINPESVPTAPSVEELLAKAQAAGDAPQIKEDKDNQVTLLDYSDIL